MGYYYRSDKESPFHEFLTQPEHIHVVCDAEVASDLVSLDINGTDYYNNLSIVCKVAEHSQFAVGLEGSGSTRLAWWSSKSLPPSSRYSLLPNFAILSLICSDCVF